MEINKDLSLFIIGDSLVSGVGSTSGGWAQRFAKKWPKTTIIGLPGATSRELLEKLANTSRGNLAEANVVIVHVGINDSRLRPNIGACEVPLEEFSGNLIKIKNFFPNAEKIAFIGLHHVIESLTTPYKPDRYYLNCLVSVYDYAIRNIADSLNSTYIDMPGLDCGNMMADGLHPSDKGYLVILYRVISILNILC